MSEKGKSQKLQITHVPLPSGRAVRLYSHGAPNIEGADALNEPEETGLHTCPKCHSDSVQPIESQRDEADKDHPWTIYLECQNGDYQALGRFTDKQVYDLEEHIENQVEELECYLGAVSTTELHYDLDTFLLRNLGHIPLEVDIEADR
jgi:DNA-directed RNA polymerase subunit M/transcription elongation factor TFIIS